MAKDVLIRGIIIGQIGFIVTLIVSLLIRSCHAQFGFGNFFSITPPAGAPPPHTDNIPNFFSPPTAPIVFSRPQVPGPPPGAVTNLDSPPAPTGRQPKTFFQNHPPTHPPQQRIDVKPSLVKASIFSPPPMTPTFTFSAPPPQPPSITFPFTPPTPNVFAPPPMTPAFTFSPPPPQPPFPFIPPTPYVFAPPPMTPAFTFSPPPPQPPSTAFPFTPPTPNFFAPPPIGPTNNIITSSPPPTPSNSFISPIAPPTPATAILPASPPPNPPAPAIPPTAPPEGAPASLSAPPVSAPAIGPGPVPALGAPVSAPAIGPGPVPAPVSLGAPPESGPAIGPGPVPAPVSLSAPSVSAPAIGPGPVPAPVSLGAPPVSAPAIGPGPVPAPVSLSAPPVPAPAPTPITTYMIVTPFGYGEYTTVQSAIEAVPVNNSSPVIIELPAGTYTEKLTIPATKPHITLQGAGMSTTIITHNDTANITGSTSRSATMSVDAAYFTARNLTFQNSAPEATPGEIGAQAVAMRIAGDMAAFYGCSFVSSQDTLLDELGRHYFSDCYIEGNIDVIWGNGQSLYQSCEIQSIAKSNGGSLTAQGRISADQTTGFSFVGGSITGTGNNLLGRAYGTYSRVVFIDTYMENIINAAGWSTWPQNTSTSNRQLLANNANTTTVYYGEYGNTGPGANLTKRVSWEKQLTAEEVTSFTDVSFIDGSLWLT